VPHLRTLLAALLLLASLAAPAAAAQGGDGSPPYGNRYLISHLDLHAAELLAWDLCPQKERCKVSSTMTGEGVKVLEVLADAATHERIVQALAREDAAPPTQVFQLHLLEGSTAEAGATPADLPAGARKALEDLRGFLPYKSYRLLDAAWLPTTGGVQARLVGDGGASYQAELRFKRVGDRKENRLFVEFFRLHEEGTSLALKDAQGNPRPPRQLITTSFGLDIGETVVVGTSRVDGASDKAFVILLTAVADPAP
jgi:hypothetical protein